MKPLPTAQQLRILLAEDNIVNQEIAAAVLQRAGHDVDVVENGHQAVGALKEVKYDIVLMDIHMPEMDGITATSIIRGLEGDVSSIPIIALTADAMVGDREKYLAVGMDAYLSKPFDPDQLNAIIQESVALPKVNCARMAA